MRRLAAVIVMLVVASLTLVPPGSAQSTPYKEGSVWAMQFLRVRPGKFDDYLNWVRGNALPFFEAARKKGLILSYRFVTVPAFGRDDWDVVSMVEYKNMAALDDLREKFEPLREQIAGSPAERRAMTAERNELRDEIGTKLGRELILRDSTPPPHAAR